MDYFKKCPKCGRHMMFQYTGNSGIPVVYVCECGYCDDLRVQYDNKTTYMGGGASDRTVDRKNYGK